MIPDAAGGEGPGGALCLAVGYRAWGGEDHPRDTAVAVRARIRLQVRGPTYLPAVALLLDLFSARAEVLLLSAGATLAAGTDMVKKRLRNFCSALGVQSRTQTAARAGALRRL